MMQVELPGRKIFQLLDSTMMSSSLIKKVDITHLNTIIQNLQDGPKMAD
jgi:hypothetical protein